MEETQKDLILFIVIASSAVVLFLIAVVVDIFLLYRKRKIISHQEMLLKEKEIDELILKNEVESVNALLKGQNTERRRISQELHDRLGSILFTAKLYHGNIESKIQEIEKEQKEGYTKLTGLLDEAVQEVRRISHDLYNGSVATFGYSVAIQQLIAALESGNDIEISANIDGEVKNQSVELQHALYAISQELLSNTLKHAKADKINLEIEIGTQLVFRYSDDGNGFDSKQNADGIGLLNIENRVAKLNGQMELSSTAETGTNYYIQIPL